MRHFSRGHFEPWKKALRRSFAFWQGCDFSKRFKFAVQFRLEPHRRRLPLFVHKSVTRWCHQYNELLFYLWPIKKASIKKGFEIDLPFENDTQLAFLRHIWQYWKLLKFPAFFKTRTSLTLLPEVVETRDDDVVDDDDVDGDEEPAKTVWLRSAQTVHELWERKCCCRSERPLETKFYLRRAAHCWPAANFCSTNHHPNIARRPRTMAKKERKNEQHDTLKRSQIFCAQKYQNCPRFRQIWTKN